MPSTVLARHRATMLSITLCQASCFCGVIICYDLSYVLVAGTGSRYSAQDSAVRMLGCDCDSLQETYCKCVYLPSVRALTSRQTN